MNAEIEEIEKILARFLPVLNDFIHHLNYERRLSRHTITHYLGDLKHCAIFLGLQYNIPSWAEVKEEHLREYLAYHRQSKKTARSINRKISSLRSFYRYLVGSHPQQHNPMSNIHCLKTPHLLPKPLDVDQMSQLLSFSPKNFLELRDLCCFELLYSTGLRLSELVALNLEDLDLMQDKISVLGKGKKTRIVFIGCQAKLALEAWLLARSEVFVSKASVSEIAALDTTAVFINQKGKRLSGRMIQKRLASLGLKQQIFSRVTPHRLRHSFASHLLESSGDLRSVQELLGHNNLSSTQVYTAINFQQLSASYDKFHPRARKKSDPP